MFVSRTSRMFGNLASSPIKKTRSPPSRAPRGALVSLVIPPFDPSFPRRPGSVGRSAGSIRGLGIFVDFPLLRSKSGVQRQRGYSPTIRTIDCNSDAQPLVLFCAPGALELELELGSTRRSAVGGDRRRRWRRRRRRRWRQRGGWAAGRRWGGSGVGRQLVLASLLAAAAAAADEGRREKQQRLYLFP